MTAFRAAGAGQCQGRAGHHGACLHRQLALWDRDDAGYRNPWPAGRVDRRSRGSCLAVNEHGVPPSRQGFL